MGVVCPGPGAIYMYITIIFNYVLLGNWMANQSQSLCEVSFGREDINS